MNIYISLASWVDVINGVVPDIGIEVDVILISDGVGL
ncbi:hypothetical protein ED21_21729 [Erythrobacter sp. SD-21]|nr:hypothetical protein ED21_21729 [Erythrobacter sp. SD-21]